MEEQRREEREKKGNIKPTGKKGLEERCRERERGFFPRFKLQTLNLKSILQKAFMVRVKSLKLFYYYYFIFLRVNDELVFKRCTKKEQHVKYAFKRG